MTNTFFDLQRFADPVQGSKILYLLRILEEAATKDASVLAFQTEGSTSISNDADSVSTKDGPIRIAGTPEIEHSLTSILTKGDANIKALRTAALEGKAVEVWEVNLDEKGTGENSSKYASNYSQGYITSFEESANSEDFATISLTVGVSGIPQSGYATLTAEQQEAAQYVFADVTKTGA